MTIKDGSNRVQIHDKAFRNAMSDLRVAKDFLEHYLPIDIKNKIDLHTLKLCKESYIDEELKALITDVLYQVELTDKRKGLPVFIYVLCEHLSSPQKNGSLANNKIYLSYR